MSPQIRWLLVAALLAAVIVWATPRYIDLRDAKRNSAARAALEVDEKKLKEMLEATPLRLSDLASKYRTATTVVSEVLEAERENPDEFRALVEDDGKCLVFHLWHLSAFEDKREAAAKGLSVIGNPGGKCRSIEFDPVTGKASRSMFWQ